MKRVLSCLTNVIYKLIKYIIDFRFLIQEKLLELKEDQQRAEMDLKKVTKENESLKGPLKEAQNTVEELTQKMTNYVKDKQRLMASLKLIIFIKTCYYINSP